MSRQLQLRAHIAATLAASARRLAPPSEPARGDPVGAALATLEAVPILDLQRRGWHFQRRDFYSALNDLDFLAENRDLWHDRPLPTGIDWDLDAQLATIEEIAPFAGELGDVPWDEPPGPPAYFWNNDFWRGIDALVHYGLLRRFQPQRIVEIGCGWSSLLMARAVAATDAGRPTVTSVHQIEPYPRRELMANLPESWTKEETILQRASLASFEALRDGDVVFYDGSHVSRPGSDVNWFLFEVVPRLAPGVIVHVHDILWPSDYPDDWVFERGQTWNEQYVMQAFLMFNEEFELLVANAALLSERLDAMRAAFRGVADFSGGASIWLRRRQAR